MPEEEVLGYMAVVDPSPGVIGIRYKAPNILPKQNPIVRGLRKMNYLRANSRLVLHKSRKIRLF